MPYARTALEILADWRACIHDLEIVADDTAEGRQLCAEVERLRREYHELANEAARANRKALPPFPERPSN